MFMRFFPLWALILAIIAYSKPDFFIQLKPLIIPLLGLIMFGMGITLLPEDFKRVLQQPKWVAIGIALQFILMPLLAWALGLALSLPKEYLLGLILVGSCSGGTASNVICYLSRGDVALSITLTTASTLLGVIATPLLTWLYLKQSIDVPFVSMLITIFKIIIIPVLAGVLINRLFGKGLKPYLAVFPRVSVFAIVLIIAIIVALNQTHLSKLGLLLCLAVSLHNLLGLLSGYSLGRLLGADEQRARTLAIEVGMQNSGLAVALAVKYFSAAAALPGALFSLWHNISGALLAAYWRTKPPQHASSDSND